MRCSSCAALFPKHVLQGRDIDRATDYNRAPLGTGPYRVAEWKSGEYIRLERVPNYWRGSEYPHIKQILFRFIPNTNTRINQLKSGEVHLVAMFPWDKHREVAAHPGRDRPPHAGQRLRARHPQPAPRGGVPRRAGPPRADARHRSRHHRVRDPRRAGAGDPRRHPARVLGVHARGHHLPVRSRPGRARCSTRPAGATPTATASGRRTASRCVSR